MTSTIDLHRYLDIRLDTYLSLSTTLETSTAEPIPTATACPPQAHLLVGDISVLMADEALRSEALQHLSSYRRSKVEAISHARGQAQSIGASLLLNALLSEYGLQEKDMTYEENEHGKPAFTNSHLIFNISHSGAMVGVIAEVKAQCTAPTYSLGLDLQRITSYRPELVRRVFSASDRQRLALATDESSRQRLFIQLWCRAEAYAKATGKGLTWPFPTPPSTAHFHDFDIGEDYCGCVCVDNLING
ncbi:MAG: 4'-phosphopantetheinyl transferase superfamily protein [Bacteroidales bacterium]|nr:4'-phosphopantetheinyl transferase superfamily protein [Bacteroidales bacterium]